MPGLPEETTNVVIKAPRNPKSLILGSLGAVILLLIFILALFLANFLGVLSLSSYIPVLSFLPAQRESQIVAKVGDKKITGLDFDQEFEATLGLYAEQETGNQKSRERVLNNLIEKEIVRQEAAKLGISVSPEEINKIYQEQVRQAGGQDKYEAILEANGWTLADQRKKTQDELLKEKVEEKVIAWRLVEGASLFKDTLSSSFEAQKEEAVNSLEQVRRLILAGRSVLGAVDEAKKKENIDQLIRYNEPVKVKKGDTWDPEFIKAFFALEKGDISEVVSSSGGAFMVAKILDANDGQYASYQEWFEDVKK